MRAWNLGLDDPLALTIAADFRLCTPDYTDDHIWEIETTGDPPAFSLRTTYGLRARLMRIFPRFTLADRTVTDPIMFAVPPRLRSFYPNALRFEFSPFPDVEVIAEYWIPDSHTASSRLTITNRRSHAIDLILELCGQLVPLDGQALTPVTMQSANVLAGSSAGLAPVLFLTGGPQPGSYPSLAVQLDLDSSVSRSLTWVQAALADPSDSFVQARRTCARPWDAEMARLEQVNAAQIIEITSGEPDWDAAFALSQKTAFGLFFSASQFLPYPSFVQSRQPDHGYSYRGDGADYPPRWNGQTALDSYFMTGLLTGAPELADGLLRNFLAVQAEDGAVDWKPGLAGQRGRRLAAPLLSSMALRTYRHTLNIDFLRELQPSLQTFIHSWFDSQHDRDQDGFPEWDHSLQTGLEDNPAFTLWQPGGLGQAISAVENPAMAAMACREFLSLAEIAEALGQPSEAFKTEAQKLRSLAEACWNDSSSIYLNRDRDSHLSIAGKVLARQRGSGKIHLDQAFAQPVRLLVRIDLSGESTRRIGVSLHGKNGTDTCFEALERMDFQWASGSAVATSRCLYEQIDEVELIGLQSRDRASVQIMDFSAEDIGLFLPLWAAIPGPDRAVQLVEKALFDSDRFGAPYGIPTCTIRPPNIRRKAQDPDMEATRLSVHIPWNGLIGEGLIAYGFRDKAALLVGRLMSAVVRNLKEQHAFYHSYSATTGAGLGDRNSLQGLAPLELFLDTLGVEILSDYRVTISGRNPFPWPVTVKYKGLTVTRSAEQTQVVFPDGQSLSLDDPTDAVISAD